MKRFCVMLAGLGLFASCNATSPQTDPTEAENQAVRLHVVANDQTAIRGICAQFAPLAGLSPPVGVYLTAACADDVVIAKVASSPTGTAWVAKVVNDLLTLLSNANLIGQADEAALAALCGGEKPEGLELVNDVEHIPGTNPPVVAPPWMQTIEQHVEQWDYRICMQWWHVHPSGH
jgi:hypothetical protein